MPEESALTVLLQEYKEQKQKKDLGHDDKFDAAQRALADLLAREPRASKEHLTEHASHELLPILCKLYDPKGESFKELMVELMFLPGAASGPNLAPIVLAKAFPELMAIHEQEIWDGVLGSAWFYKLFESHIVYENLFNVFGSEHGLVQGLLVTYYTCVQDGDDEVKRFCTLLQQIADKVKEKSFEVEKSVRSAIEGAGKFDKLLEQERTDLAGEDAAWVLVGMGSVGASVADEIATPGGLEKDASTEWEEVA